jgi:threonine aldolase
MITQSEINAVRNNCRHELAGHGRENVQRTLLRMADACDPHWTKDHYGAGDHINRFEERIARLIGKPAAVFMPSGTMAQQIAVRIWADRSGHRNIGMHPSCHMYVHEEHGYRELHQLQAVLIGNPARTISFADIELTNQSLSSVVIELPQRHNGGQLTAWEDLEKTRSWADRTGTKLHLDGARLWETASWYGKSVAETAALFDSVYLSFYKGIGGIGGAVLAGSDGFVSEARIWLRRHGGNLVHLFPYIIAAENGLDTRLPRMPAYFARAQEIAAMVRACSEIRLTSDSIQTNMMHLRFSTPAEKTVAAALEASRRTGVWLLGGVWVATGCDVPIFEWYVGDAALALESEHIAAYLRTFDQLLRDSKG